MNNEPMSDERQALQYAIEALTNLYARCNTEEEREELSEAIQTLESMEQSAVIIRFLPQQPNWDVVPLFFA
jgi:hypothetical protein